MFQGYEGTDKAILAYQTDDRKNAPDINQGLTSTIPSMMDLSWTVDLTPWIEKEENAVKKMISMSLCSVPAQQTES